MAASAFGTKIWLKTPPWSGSFRGAASDQFLGHFYIQNGPQNGPRLGPRGCPGRLQKLTRKQTQKRTQNGPRGGPQMDPRTVQNGLLGARAVGDEAPEAPLEPTMGQNGSKNGPGWAPRDPLGAHDGPKWLPAWPRMGPKGPLGPKMDQNGTQNRPIWCPNGPRTHRNSPPRAPR